MNNQKLRIARIKRMADKKFGRHKCPNGYGFLPVAAIRTHRTLASSKFSENNICQIREIRS